MFPHVFILLMLAISVATITYRDDAASSGKNTEQAKYVGEVLRQAQFGTIAMLQDGAPLRSVYGTEPAGRYAIPAYSPFAAIQQCKGSGQGGVGCAELLELTPGETLNPSDFKRKSTKRTRGAAAIEPSSPYYYRAGVALCENFTDAAVLAQVAADSSGLPGTPDYSQVTCKPGQLVVAIGLRGGAGLVNVQDYRWDMASVSKVLTTRFGAGVRSAKLDPTSPLSIDTFYITITPP